MSRKRHSAVCLLLLPWLSGCESLYPQSEPSTQTGSHPWSEEAQADVDGADAGRRAVAAYVNFMGVLNSSDELGWHNIFELSLQAYEEDPSQEKRLRLALVLTRADRESEESRIAQELLIDARDLLVNVVEDPTPMDPLVRKFALVQLTEVERRLALHTELESLRSELTRVHQEYQTAQRDRDQAKERIRRVDAALAEANAKLEAVMDIERDIGPLGKETFP
jgi:hypothetical protein